MAKTTADVLFERLVAWGVDVIFGLPGDGINGFMEALRKHQDKIRFIQVPARGGGGVRGLRLRQVHRAAGRLHRHQRPRRDPPAQRPLRRQARRRPGAGDHRADLPRPDGHALPAGDQPPRRCSRTWRSSTSRSTGPSTPTRWSTPPAARRCRRRGVAHLNCPNDWQEHDRTRRSSVDECVKGHTSAAWTAADRRPAGGVAQERPPRAQRRQEDRHPGRARGPWAPATSWSRWPTSWRRRSSRRCWARRSSPTTRPYTTGGLGLLGTLPSEKAMEECDTPADRRHELPLHAVPAQARPGQGRPDRPRPDAARPALPDRRRPDRRRQGDAPGPAAAAQAPAGPLVPGEGPGADEGMVGADARRARTRDDVAAQAAGRRPARQRPARRQRHRHDRLGHDHHLGGAAHQDPPGDEVLLLGQPGDDGAGPALRHRAPRSPIPTARSSRSSATAGSRC